MRLEPPPCCLEPEPQKTSVILDVGGSIGRHSQNAKNRVDARNYGFEEEALQFLCLHTFGVMRPRLPYPILYIPAISGHMNKKS